MERNDEKVWDKLLTIAMKDGIITEEEEKVLGTILKSMEEFQSALKKAKEDNILTPAEEKELLHLREQIWEKAYTVAKEDKNISIDEHQLLIKLARLLSSLKIE